MFYKSEKGRFACINIKEKGNVACCLKNKKVSLYVLI